METTIFASTTASTKVNLNSGIRPDGAPFQSRIFEAEHAYDPMDWASVRAQFDLDPRLAHLANFYLASYPKPVRDSIEHYRKALDDDPHSFLNDNMFVNPAQALWRHVAEHAARYVGGDADEIAFTGNTTMGLALIYNGLTLRRDQEVLTTRHEFYPHFEAIRLATQKWGSGMRQVSLYDDSAKATVEEMVTRLVDAIRPRTRIVAITWVHSGTGVVLPVRAVAAALAPLNRDREESDRLILVVDGVHGFGILDEDVAGMGCDFFAAGTHKWILGPHGTGIVWGNARSWPLVHPTIPSLMAREPATPTDRSGADSESDPRPQRMDQARSRGDEARSCADAAASGALRRVRLLRSARRCAARSRSAASSGWRDRERRALRRAVRPVLRWHRQQRAGRRARAGRRTVDGVAARPYP
jgi:hypothetical protein